MGMVIWISIASQDVSPIGGYDGTIVRLTHQGVGGKLFLACVFWRALLS